VIVSPLSAIVEAILLASSEPVSLSQLLELFALEPLPDGFIPTRHDLQVALEVLDQRCQGGGMTLTRVASGYRLQARQEWMPWVSRLWDERPPRYSRALLETLALIAYRQPVTRGDIEDVRGVAVSSGIIKTLQERGWIQVVGHRNVPGRPALFSTTAAFLDYFCLAGLDQLPSLADVQALGEITRTREDDSETAPSRIGEALPDDLDEQQADVLALTASELQQADALVAQVEANLYGEAEADGPASLGDIIERLSAASTEAAGSNHHASEPEQGCSGAKDSEKE